MSLNLSDHQEELLERMNQNGGITSKDGLEIYTYPRAFYRAVDKLEQENLCERCKAPPKLNKEWMWTITARGRAII